MGLGKELGKGLSNRHRHLWSLRLFCCMGLGTEAGKELGKGPMDALGKGPTPSDLALDLALDPGSELALDTAWDMASEPVMGSVSEPGSGRASVALDLALTLVAPCRASSSSSCVASWSCYTLPRPPRESHKRLSHCW